MKKEQRQPMPFPPDMDDSELSVNAIKELLSDESASPNRAPLKSKSISEISLIDLFSDKSQYEKKEEELILNEHDIQSFVDVDNLSNHRPPSAPVHSEQDPSLRAS